MIKKISLFFAGFLCFMQAYAALQLELTQGVNAATPIAIQPFVNQANNVPGNTTISQIITSDLQNSGEFNVVPAKGATYLVTGEVTPVASGRYKVSFVLQNLYAQPSPAQLLTQSFTASQTGLRQLAHHISDLIYQKITGSRGIFTTKIAYILKQGSGNNAHYQLIVADQDGFSPQTLVSQDQPIMSPTWKPNGRELAYVSFEGHRQTIYLQNLASGGRERIADFPGVNSAPAFSPNAHRLALVLTRSGNLNIYVMDLATRQLTQITNDYAIDTEPTWSPDGKFLYFTSDRSGGPQIYRYNFATHQTDRITFDGNYNARACISSQGDMLVMMHRDGDVFTIAKQDLSSGRMTQLTGSGSDDSPSLAPNGKMVLYGTRYAGREMLGLVSIDGRVKLRLPSQEGDVQDPSWSPYLN